MITLILLFELELIVCLNLLGGSSLTPVGLREYSKTLLVVPLGSLISNIRTPYDIVISALGKTLMVAQGPW